MTTRTALLAFGTLMLGWICARIATTPAPTMQPTKAVVYAGTGELASGSPPSINPHNLIILLLDTVRHDAVALGEDTVSPMPFLSSLAKRGIAFRQATSPAPWTVPAVASILTGLAPRDHGCWNLSEHPRLPAQIPTYAEILRWSYGYETAAFTDEHWHRLEPWSVLQGFAEGSAGRSLEEPIRGDAAEGFSLHEDWRRLDDWTKRRDPSKPFFLFLHSFDAHDPYGRENHPPVISKLMSDRPAFEAAMRDYPLPEQLTPAHATQLFLTSRTGRFAMHRKFGDSFIPTVVRYMTNRHGTGPEPGQAELLRSAYEAGLREVDAGVERLVAKLRKDGLLENTVFVILSDHGEAFGEHGTLGHCGQLYDELVRVPMIIMGPSTLSNPRVVEEAVGTVDILPTFFELIGAPLPGSGIGQSLLPQLEGKEPFRPIISEEATSPIFAGDDRRHLVSSVRTASWKYICLYDVGRGIIEERLYSLEADPGEMRNLLVDGVMPEAVDLPDAYRAEIDAARARIWDAADSIGDRQLTPYGAGVPRTHQRRPRRLTQR